MNKKTCIITGANSGIGKETAIELAKLGFHIIMICRNKEKGEIAKKEIIRTSNNNSIDLLIGDLGSLSSIKKVSEEITKKYEKIDVLINNAGVFHWDRQETEDGFESTFGVDYLGHFYLNYLLLDLIKNSAPARIINVSSDIHKFFGVNMNDLMSKKKYNSQKAYSNAKGAQVLFTYYLANRLSDTGVTVNALHPGHVRTNITASDNKFFNFITKLIPIYISPEEAAKTSIYLASSPEVEGVSGKYFKKCKPTKSGKITYNKEVQKKLWVLSLYLLRLKQSGDYTKDRECWLKDYTIDAISEEIKKKDI